MAKTTQGSPREDISLKTPQEPAVSEVEFATTDRELETSVVPPPEETPFAPTPETDNGDDAYYYPDSYDYVGGIDDEPPVPRRSFAQALQDFPSDMQYWARSISPEQWAYVGVLILGAFLRFWALGDKPVHHDESLHAYFAWTFWKNPSSYTYDPLLHGPFQFHIIPIFYAMGAALGLSGGGANDFTVRILPALLGTGMVILPYWLRSFLGRWGALSMSLLLAISPTFVYYSRFVRDDIYVTFFTLLVVVAALQFSRTRRIGWLLTGVAALVLSYTAMENTFFVVAVFGSFLAAVALWDLGPSIGGLFRNTFADRDQPLAGRVVVLVPFAIVMGVLALFGLHWLGQMSTTINAQAAAHPGAGDPLNPDNIVAGIEGTAFGALIVASIFIALAFIIALLVQTLRSPEASLLPQDTPRWRRWLNPRTQPALDALLSIHWIQWFVAFIVAWVIFAVFFWKIPTNPASLQDWVTGLKTGVGKGMIHGIYYWLEQQHVARGNQPWYYYFILIPLYEPLALVFGLAGLVRALIQPSRFRLFLVYWFVANVALYSWAGEKMPWLVIHMVLPLIGLAGIAFEWIFQTLARGARGWWQPTRVLVAVSAVCLIIAVAAINVTTTMLFTLIFAAIAIIGIGVAAVMEVWFRRRAMRMAVSNELSHLAPAPRWTATMQQGIALGCLAFALVLLVPTVWNMQRVSFYDPSVAPNEMLVYVQTTTDVTNTMAKIDALDAVKNNGKHLHNITVGVTAGAVWPYVWYLHDYSHVLLDYTPGSGGPLPDVIISDSDTGTATVTAAYQQGQYATHHYRLRWWWDESYKLPTCTKTKTSNCNETASWDAGAGPFLWLTYGAHPPAACGTPGKAACDPENDSFNGGMAAQRYWNWLWQRQNISGVTNPGSTDFDLFILNQDVTSSHIAP